MFRNRLEFKILSKRVTYVLLPVTVTKISEIIMRKFEVYSYLVCNTIQPQL